MSMKNGSLGSKGICYCSYVWEMLIYKFDQGIRVCQEVLGSGGMLLTLGCYRVFLIAHVRTMIFGFKTNNFLYPRTSRLTGRKLDLNESGFLLYNRSVQTSTTSNSSNFSSTSRRGHLLVCAGSRSIIKTKLLVPSLAGLGRRSKDATLVPPYIQVIYNI